MSIQNLGIPKEGSVDLIKAFLLEKGPSQKPSSEICHPEPGAGQHTTDFHVSRAKSVRDLNVGSWRHNWCVPHFLPIPKHGHMSWLTTSAIIIRKQIKKAQLAYRFLIAYLKKSVQTQFLADLVWHRRHLKNCITPQMHNFLLPLCYLE